MDATLFPDTESIIIDLLDNAVSQIQVCGKVPNPRPDRFIRVERVGGPRETRVSEAGRYVIEGWGLTDVDAASTLNQARTALFDLEGALFGVDEYGGPARLPDPESLMSRYTASFTIRARAISTPS